MPAAAGCTSLDVGRVGTAGVGGCCAGEGRGGRGALAGFLGLGAVAGLPALPDGPALACAALALAAAAAAAFAFLPFLPMLSGTTVVVAVCGGFPPFVAFLSVSFLLSFVFEAAASLALICILIACSFSFCAFNASSRGVVLG